MKYKSEFRKPDLSKREPIFFAPEMGAVAFCVVAASSQAASEGNMKKKSRLSSLAAILAGALGVNGLGVSAVSAQSVAGIEEIVVTAERRESTIQETAISITTMSGKDILSKNLNTVDSVLRDIPGLVVQGNANGAYVYVRGIGSQQDTAIGGPAVNLNVDGVYQQQTDAPFAAIYDLERIEVLRGPQGTLYGRNATAGSINIITANPNFGRISGHGSVSMGNYNMLRTEGAFNAPLSDTLAVRIAGMTHEHEGYIQPSGYDDADDKGARVKLLWKPSEAIDLLLTYDDVRVAGAGGGAVFPETPEGEDAWYSMTQQGFEDLDYKRYVAELNADLGFGTLTILPAHQEYAKFDNRVLIPPPPFDLTTPVGAVNENQDTFEVRLASNEGAAFDWLVGAYYLDSESNNPYEESRTSVPAGPVSYPRLAGSNTTSQAVFSQVTVPLTEMLRLTAGIRYTKDEKELFRQLSESAFEYPGKEFTSTTYKLGFEYDVADDAMLYGGVSTGFKAGGLDQAFNTYEPEELEAYSLGIKSQWIDSRLQLNGELFFYDYTDFQAQFGYRCQNAADCPAIVDFANTIINAGNATVYGGELEALFYVTDTLRFTASLGYNHSNFDRLVLVLGTERDTGGVPWAGCSSTLTCPLEDDELLIDEPLANAPEVSFSLGVEKSFVLSTGDRIVAQADTHYYDGYWTDYRQSQESAYQDSYTKSNASLGYEQADGRYSVRAYVKNVANEAVTTAVIGPVRTLAAPRTYGVQATVNF